MTTTNHIEETILECLSDLETIKVNQRKVINGHRRAQTEVNIKTSKVVHGYQEELNKLKIKHFERFIKLIVEIRNMGNKKNGYQKKHLISEFQNYLDAKGLNK